MLGFDWNLIEGAILAFIRTGTAIALMPLFGYTAVPMQVKAAISFILAIILAPSAALALPHGMVLSVMPIVGAAMNEAIIGLAIGAVTLLFLIGAEFAGTLVGLQMGFASVTLFDPMVGAEVSIVGKLQNLLAMIIFISLDGHHLLLAALGSSFEKIPLGGGVLNGQAPLLFARLTADVFVVAVKLAAPVMAIIILSEVALGFISRAMPQMNIFIISFPLKIGIGLVGLALTLPLFVYVLSKSFDHYNGGLLKMIELFGP